MASRLGRFEIAKFLIAHGADVNAKDYHQETPLQMAARYGFPHLVELYVRSGANVNYCQHPKNIKSILNGKDNYYNRKRFTAINYREIHANYGYLEPAIVSAAKQGHLTTVQKLVGLGADWNLGTPEGITALHAAAYSENLELVQYLVELGLNVNATDRFGVAPIHIAISSKTLNNTRTIRYLLEKGANVNSGAHPIAGVKFQFARQDIITIYYKNRLPDFCETPLSIAVGWQLFDVVHLLIDHGANVNCRGHMGYTPLLSAALQGDPRSKKFAMMKTLLKAGADVNARTDDNRSIWSFVSKKSAFWKNLD